MTRSPWIHAVFQASQQLCDRHLELDAIDTGRRDDVFGDVIEPAPQQFGTVIEEGVEAAQQLNERRLQSGSASLWSDLQIHSNLSVVGVELATVEALVDRSSLRGPAAGANLAGAA